MTEHDQELAELHATIAKLQAENEARAIQIQKKTAELKANSIRIAKEQRMLELGRRISASHQASDPHLIWALIEAEGEKAARQQANLLEGLSDDEVFREVKRQQKQVKAARTRRKRRRRRKVHPR